MTRLPHAFTHPTSQDSAMTRRPFSSLMLGGAMLALSACASLGGTVKADFDCRAPAGSCAPMSSIDDRAVSKLAGKSAASVTRDNPAPHLERRSGVGSSLARTPDRVLRIVLPAHVDSAGVLHEAAVVHAVVERGAWVEALTGPVDIAPSPSTSSRSLAPSSLREAIAGASAPAVEGLDVSPFDQAPQDFDPPAPAADTTLRAAALEAARAGHRIAAPGTLPLVPAARPQTDSAPPVADRGAPADEQLEDAGQRADAARRAGALAKPALEALGARPLTGNPGIQGQIFPPVPRDGEAPR